MDQNRRTAWVAVALVLLAASGLYAQTTGRMLGQIADQSGAPVPGVTVTITSPQLQGSLTAITDGSGDFRFLTLPPGTYHVKAQVSGFKTVEQGNITIGLDRTVNLALKMEVASVSETVTVEGAAPVIDVTSTTTGVNATPELFNRLPVQRDFYSISRVAPGAQDDGVGPSFYGSTGAENQYIIEGLNTTGIEVGGRGKTLNFDFVQEIEVKTGGLPAEYGRITGGLMNVLTKSGGNQFRGSGFGFFEGKGLQSDNTTGDKRPQTTTTVGDIDQKYDVGGELGGYLAKDKLWFFGAYNYVRETDNTTVIRPLSPGAPALGAVVPTDVTRHLFAGKLTWRPAANHSLTASAFGDPSKRDGVLFAIAGADNTWKGTLDTGSTDFVGRYDGTFGSNFLIQAIGGFHQEKVTYGGAGRDIVQLLDQRVNPNLRTGGFAFFQDEDLKRKVGKLDITKFFSGHEIKLGGDMEMIDTDISRAYGGGQLVYGLQTSAGVTYYRHRFFVNDRAPGFSATNPAGWQLAFPLVSKPSTDNTSAYLQDSWKIARTFTINAGVRWERQNIKNRDGETVIDLKKNWAPRVGFIWDFAKNGKSKLFANYGRFYENIPQDINIRAFGGELLCFCYNFDPNPGNFLPAAGARASSLLGGPEPVSDDLKGQFINEFIGGVEYEVAPNLAVGIKGSYRNLGRVIEDFLIPSEGNYFIANPSFGLGKDLAFYDGSSTAPSPKARRRNIAVELTARKRWSNNWQFLASYVFSKLDGNYDGLFQNSTGQLDPNINSAFDYADFLVNSEGRLSSDVRHQFKFDGSYEVKNGALGGLNMGLSTHWFSGLPANAYGYSFAYANWEYYLVPRGSAGEHPADYEADLHLGYPIKMGDRSRLNLVLDVFNLLNRQAIVQFDERYNLVSDGACAGVPSALCNGDGGLVNVPNTVTAAGSIPNPRATATNPDYLRKGIGFTGQRSIRFGIRLNF